MILFNQRTWYQVRTLNPAVEQLASTSHLQALLGGFACVGLLLRFGKTQDLERFSAFVSHLYVHLVKRWIAFRLNAEKNAHDRAVFATFPPALKKRQTTGAHILLRRDILNSISRSGGRYMHLFAYRAVKRERRNRSLPVLADSTLPYGANVNEVAAGQTDYSATLPE